MKEEIKYITPPVLVELARRLRSIVYEKATNDDRAPQIVEWEYVPEGWSALESDSKIKGWNVDSVLGIYQAKWPGFIKQLEGTQPFGLAHESDLSTQTDPIFHNIIMSYGYVLGLAGRHRNSISMLDWGGGIGHYYLISRALIPDLEIDYHCKDVPVLSEYGRELFPHAHFYTDDSCLQRQYDFVLASTSLHYSQDWAASLRGLTRAARGYIFITQLPIVHQSSSFVMVQRPYNYGYDTEYLGWCINRQEFLERAEAEELELVREFIVGYQPQIRNAPEQCEYRGYLFRSRSMTDPKSQEPAKE
jgi:putative methyltransferase (TIGR04325 family)